MALKRAHPTVPARTRRNRLALCLGALLLWGWGCAGAGAARSEPAGGRLVLFEGMCDASGAVALSPRRLLVADDEDNVLRVYDAELGGPPLQAVDLAPALRTPVKGKARPRAAEADIEAATELGGIAYWVTSHGRDSKGRPRRERLLLFATTASLDAPPRLVAEPYPFLLQDLLANPDLARFDLASAALRAPKARGGLNIEGLTATPEGWLLLAFRNPLPEGKALLVALLNPGELFQEGQRARARFGAPVLLDLGGLGVRSLSWWRGRHLIAAGPVAEGGDSRLYDWDGTGPAREIPAADLRDFNPEGFFTPESRDEILLLSDDGNRAVGGTPCKKLRDPAKKRFRGLWLRLPQDRAPP